MAGDQGVTVGRGARGAQRADGAAGAADVLDHEVLTEMAGKDVGAMRPMMSAGPPAANGTITVTVRVG